jgi:hypothetical protein
MKFQTSTDKKRYGSNFSYCGIRYKTINEDEVAIDDSLNHLTFNRFLKSKKSRTQWEDNSPPYLPKVSSRRGIKIVPKIVYRKDYEYTATSVNGFLFNVSQTGLKHGVGGITLCNTNVQNILPYAFAYPCGHESGNIRSALRLNNVRVIHDYAYYNNPSARLPKTATFIGNYSFFGATIDGKLGENIETIGNYAFAESNLSGKVKIGKNVQTIGECAFISCPGISEFYVDDENKNFSSLNKSLFSFDKTKLIVCPILNNNMGYRISENVRKIDINAFNGCLNITEFTVSLRNQYFTAVDGVLFNYNKTILICYPSGKKNTQYLIPEGVLVIQDNAFFNAPFLETVTISSSVKKLSEKAFYNCKNIVQFVVKNNKSFYAVDGVLFSKKTKEIELLQYPFAKTSNNYVISENVVAFNSIAFRGNTILTKISIGDNVVSIGPEAFYGCKNLQTVIIGKNVRSIGTNAFADCSSLQKIIIPDSVLYIAHCAFYKCSALKTLTLGKSIKYIGQYAFCDCISLSNIDFKGSIKKIGKYAFSNCSSVNDLTLSFGMIEPYAFSHCSKLKTLDLRGGTIGSSAFLGCSSLEYIKIGFLSIQSRAFSAVMPYKIADESVIKPSALKKVTIYYGGFSSGCVNPTAFFKCDNLLEFEVVEPTHIVSTEDGILFNSGKTRLIKFPSKSNIKHYSVPDTVKRIDDYAFYNCKNLVTIGIGNNVNSLGSFSFSGCSNLITAKIGKGIKYIPPNAFSYCRNLKSIFLPNAIKTIGNSAFLECYSLTTVSISKNVKTIADKAFSCCSSLKRIIIEGNKLKTIGVRAFYNCINLKEISPIPNATIRLGKGAFQKCKSLSKIELGDGIKKIGRSAFSLCSSLTTIYIPASVTSISETAFWKCFKLTYISVSDMNNSFASIDGVLFNGSCTMLLQYPNSKRDKEYEIPESVKTIGVLAFSNSPYLVTVKNVVSTKKQAFQSCTSLRAAMFGKIKRKTLTYGNYKTVSFEGKEYYYEQIGNLIFKNCRALQFFYFLKYQPFALPLKMLLFSYKTILSADHEFIIYNTNKYKFIPAGNTVKPDKINITLNLIKSNENVSVVGKDYTPFTVFLSWEKVQKMSSTTSSSTPILYTVKIGKSYTSTQYEVDTFDIPIFEFRTTNKNKRYSYSISNSSNGIFLEKITGTFKVSELIEKQENETTIKPNNLIHHSVVIEKQENETTINPNDLIDNSVVINQPAKYFYNSLMKNNNAPNKFLTSFDFIMKSKNNSLYPFKNRVFSKSISIPKLHKINYTF